jgi:ribosomal protein S21
LISHRDEIDSAVIARKDFINKALTTLKTDIETAKTKAKSDCVSGVPGKTVRIDLKNSIQKAQKNFKKTVSSLGAIKESVTVNNDTKKTELKKIEDAFKKSIEQARVDLKNALKQRTATAVATTTQ